MTGLNSKNISVTKHIINLYYPVNHLSVYYYSIIYKIYKIEYTTNKYEDDLPIIGFLALLQYPENVIFQIELFSLFAFYKQPIIHKMRYTLLPR